jgi:hypothetical protein
MRYEWILLLGANSGMAKSTGRRFAQDGYNIYLASRNSEEMENECAHLEVKYGVQAKALHFDALNYDSHERFYSQLDQKPEGVVLAFGILGDQKKAQNNFQHAKLVLETNFISTVSILELVARDFEQRKHGFIVGISSVAGDRGRQSNYIYGSGKAGFSAYLSGLRHRLFKSGVNVLIVKPGYVATKMTATLDLPQKLTAQPEEVAEQIFKAVQKHENTIYAKPFWRLIMWIIIHLPEWIFKRTGL